jgi:transposase
MSKARLVITAVVREGRSQGEVARAYGVSQGWVSRLVARYRAEGEAAFEPRSRRPAASPRAIPDATVALITELRKELAGQGLDAGPQTIAWHLEHHHSVRISAATISRFLPRAALVTPDPAKRPKSSYLRFAAQLPNECWQADFTHYPLAGCTDQLCMCYPAPPDDPGRDRIRARNASVVIENYHAAGARCVIVNGVVDPALRVQQNLTRQETVLMCRLRADPRRGCVAAGRLGPARRRRPRPSCERWPGSDRMDASGFADVMVDTTGVPAVEVAREPPGAAPAGPAGEAAEAPHPAIRHQPPLIRTLRTAGRPGPTAATAQTA